MFANAPRAALFLAAVGLVAACGNDNSFKERRPELRLGNELVDLGTVAVGDEVTFTIQLDEVQNVTAEVTAVEVTAIEGNFFAWDGALITVAGKDTGLLTFTYSPTEVGYHRAQVRIVSDSYKNDGELFAQVRAHAAEAQATVYPRVLDFGVVDVSDSSTLEVTLDNQGEMTVLVQNADFGGNADFTFDADTPLEVAPGTTAQLPITFTAATADPSSTTMTLDLGGYVTVPDVTLRGNDCENGNPAAYDVDGDGYTSCSGDCDDNDPDARPGGVETEDGTDEDCDGIIDEGTPAYDDDGDGVSENDGDCNDGDIDVNPSADEVYGNGVDDDCDGTVDWGTSDTDADGYSEDGGDCNDSDKTIFPGAPELADGKDNDCDGTIDEGTVDYDDDGDGETETEGDCDDTDDTVYTTASEIADWIDNDCDGTVDEGTTNYDDDGDGYSELGGDCNDADDTVSPAELEITGDSIDNDCDGTTL